MNFTSSGLACFVSLWVAFLLAIQSPAIAQPRFDSWTTENGLPQNSVNDILQTRDGYLWLATFGGLVRFDGLRFVVFDRSTSGIESQRLRALHEDRQGTLWAATEDGMLIRYAGGLFKTFGRDDGLPHAAAIRIEESDDGNLWITWVGVVTTFDGHRFVNLGPRDLAPVHAPSTAYYRDAWWMQDGNGLRALIKGRVRTFPVTGARVTRAVPDRCGQLWITTSGGGLIKAFQGRIEKHALGDGVSAADGAFFGDCGGNIWFWDSGGNLYRVRDGRRESMSLAGVATIYVDREGSTWFGTVAAGLHRAREQSITLYTEAHGLSVDRAYTILQDRGNTVWVGTWDAGLNRYEGGRFKSFGPAEGLPSVRITCLFEDRTGRLWVGTQDSGLSYLEHERFQRYGDSSGFLNGSVWAMLEDRSGAFWFATDAGLVASQGGKLTRYTTADGLSDTRITALFEDRAGTLWIGGFHGVTRMSNGVFTAFTEREGLIGNQVRTFHEDSDGVLWVGTYDGGLYRLAHERLTRYTRNEGLLDNGVFQILEDDGGYLWMGSNRGIARISRRQLNDVAEGRQRSLTPLVLGTKDGLASLEVNGGRQPSGMKASDGTLWFPTMGGVAVIDPSALRRPAPAPPARIEELRIAGTREDVSEEVMIPSSTPAFDISYTAPSFIRPEQVRFRYRLIGLDDDWVDVADRRTVSFHRVPPGRYRFVVAASNAEGDWSTAGAALDVVVLPPFWRTWWFLTLVLVAGASIVIAGHEGRMRRLRKLHAVHERFSQQLIDSQERERRRIAHELHDSLGQYATIIRKRARTATDTMSDPERVGAELGEITNLAEQIGTEMHQIAYGLHPCQLDVIGLSKTIENLVHNVAAACDVTFTTDIARIDHLLSGDAGIHVYRIVQEGVSNIVTHASATAATVAIARNDQGIQIRIDDNGKGFGPESRDTAHPRQAGFGLMGMEERTRILGGTFQIRSTAAGTTVLVEIPVDGNTPA